MRLIRTIHTTSDFSKSLRRLPRKLQKLAIAKDNWFRKDAFDPRLKTHPLKGELQGFHSYSINQKMRVLFRFLASDAVIYHDIGTHDIYR